MTAQGKQRAAFPWPLFLKSAAVAAALGVHAAGIYLLWRVVHEPLLLKLAVLITALGVYAVWIYLLWRAVHKWGWSLFLKWAAVAAALGVCAVGILLLWGVWDGTPVAAAFTRVGGETRVETALEVSRFWLTPPQNVVETPTDSSQLMLEAARCAVAWDAPLLFTSSDPKRQRRINSRINDWRKIETPKDFAKSLAHPEVSTIKSQRDLWRETTLPAVITIKSQGSARNCLKSGDPAGVAGLSTLEVPNPLIHFHHVRVLQMLAPVVVFAAAIEPGHPSDVAVGLALAAHMARANREKVSLVVVPHYLESDLELENKLQSQHKQITGGVVLGQTPTVPEDTRALLRQLLTSRDRQGVLAQVQNNLGSVGSLVAALLALVGLATATRIAAPIVIERLERIEQKRTEQRENGKLPQDTTRKSGATNDTSRRGESVSIKSKLGIVGRRGPVTQKESDWLIALGENRKKPVIVRLRSGRKVTGTIESQTPAEARDATVFRIKKASSARNDAEGLGDISPPKPEGKYAYVLVSVKDIEQIHFNDPESGVADGQEPA